MLEGEVVLITGVGPGLGRKLAVEAALQGAKVVMAARSSDLLRQVENEITERGGQALGIPCDVRDEDAVARLVAAGVDRFGGISGLVNSAYSHPGLDDLLETPDRQLRRSLDVVLHGMLTVTRAVVPHMRAGGGGSIVNVGTMATRKPTRGEGAYAVAKAAAATATSYLALELGEHGIRVNHAAMGWLDGPAVRHHIRTSAEDRGLTEAEVRDEITRAIPLGRIPTDRACGGTILFLLSKHASEVTGATIDVNGGEFMP
jgi:NAD(P)-dependent dehydrogenase (short-subunit alcohol dehydrogenase family)